MKADWFEMKEIRRRRIADAVWIPLRAVETLIEEGKYGYPRYRKEFFGLGSLAVPLANREAVQKLGWSDIGIAHEQGIWATKEFYKPAEIYQYNEKEDLGIELAMVQSFDGAEPRQWHLNQDLVFALGLLREGDLWVRPSEDYIVVARLRRDANWKPIAFEIKNEYLRDYLCAKGCFLRITWYRARDLLWLTSLMRARRKKIAKTSARNGSSFEFFLSLKGETSRVLLRSSMWRVQMLTLRKMCLCPDLKPTTTSKRIVGRASARAKRIPGSRESCGAMRRSSRQATVLGCDEIPSPRAFLTLLTHPVRE
jgi:hypothetical protein